MPADIPEGRAAAPLDEVSDLLHAVNRRIRTRANRDLDPIGITGAQARALRTIAHRGEPVRMSELAELLGIVRRSATSVVDELAERGLVERRPDPVDRRGVAVAVTPAGSALLRRLKKRRRAAAADVLGGLTPDQVTQLRDLLRALARD